MNSVFASLYEWFGLLPLYSKDMGDLLRGWDITCSDYIGTKWYMLLGYIMLLSATGTYALQYHIIDNSKWNKKQHWWLFAFVLSIINFTIAFTITYNIVQSNDYCSQLTLQVFDCFGFGISNAIWSFMFFLLISTIPVLRALSTNCRHTTFWKP